MFFAPKTGALLETVPQPGQENQDYREMKRYQKYGIQM
jgi:hypothetical protein